MDLIKVAEQAFAAENPVEHPSFNTGDTVSVHYKIVEGNKERIQVFRGVVIQVKGTGSTKTFTVRKMSGNVGVERIFPIESPFIKEIEVNKVGKVRRARIYYFRINKDRIITTIKNTLWRILKLFKKPEPKPKCG